MRKLLFSLMFSLLLCGSAVMAQNAEQANPDLNLDAEYFPPTDSAVQAKLDQWQDLKFGMIIHWGLYSEPGIVESWSICSEDEDWIPRDSNVSYEQYKSWYWNLINVFYPEGYNPDQWASIAKRAGMKYVVFTTKHHDGFAMFDTKFSDFSIAKGPFGVNPKADVAKYVFDAFRKQDMMIGAYFSKPDWHSQDYWWDYYATPNRHVNYKIERHPERWSRYKDFVFNQINEITSNYGNIDILWLDGGWVRAPQEDIDMDRIATMARHNQPGLLIVDRTVTGPYENYRTPEKTIPENRLFYPWETCVPLSKDWGFVPNASFKSPRLVLNMLAEIVAKGGSLLLGVGPAPSGLIEPTVEHYLSIVGEWMSANGEAIYNTRPVRKYHDGNVWFTGSKDGKTYYAIATFEVDESVGKTISWQGNVPQKGSKMTLLATGQSLKYTVKNGTVTVAMPKNAQGNMPVALKFNPASL